MLEITRIKENREEVAKALEKKKVKNADEKVANLLAIDEKRRETQVARDNALAEANARAKEIGKLMRDGEKSKADAAKTESARLKETAKELEKALADIEAEMNEILLALPNLPHHDVPEGVNADHNEVVSEWGNIPTFGFNALPHWDLIKKHNLIDFDLGVKISGAGFPVYTGKGAKLQRALISFFLDEAENAGYTEILPPLLVNEASGFATGQLPDKEGQMYQTRLEDMYLIPTAEVPITNIYRDVIINRDDLPIKNVGYTACFRREAGSWGADVRGLNRLHQFDKVEIVQITLPEHSYQTLNQMTDHVGKLLEKLELPYRILKLCGGDLSFTSALTFDFEVFSGAQKRWLEVSSVSNFETYQSNRLKLRTREENSKKTMLLHTLNGSALALPRIVSALLENNQTPEGIKIPEALVPYTKFNFIG